MSADRSSIAASGMKESPQIFAFYSFKGGVGRSMAVLNLAYALAAKGRHVLVLDMDLEAPGLSGFLHREAEIAGFARFDMVNLVNWAFSASVPLDRVSFPPATDYIVSIAPEKLDKVPRSFSELGRLDIIPVEEERDYYDRLTSLAMGNYDQDDLVRAGSVLRAWLKSLRFPIEVPDYYGPDCERSASYDYVLVDSRTGITETGGLCIGPLSDQLVVLTALNDQNVAGTRKFLMEVGILDEGAAPVPESKPCLIVASLVPTGEIEKKRNRLNQIEQSLGKVVVKLSYHPQLALKETIFTRDYTDEYLAGEYEELLREVLRMAGDWIDDDTLKVTFDHPRTSTGFRDALHKLLRAAWMPGLAPFLSHLVATTDWADLSEDTDFILWDRLSRVLCIGKSSFLPSIINNGANLLSEWDRKSQHPELAALRFDAAKSWYAKNIQSEDVPPEYKANALFNRGVMYGERDERESAIADYDVVIQMLGATAEQTAGALINRGRVYRQLEETERAIADFTAAIEMSDAPTDQKAIARVNRGAAYSQLGDPEKAIADYASAVQVLSAFTEQSAPTVHNYGTHYPRRGSVETVIPYFVASFPVPDTSARRAGQQALALLGHGVAQNQLAQPDKAIANFTAVIEMSSAPAHHKAKARLSRGVAYGQLSEREKAIADFTAVIETSNASDQDKAVARLGRATAYNLLGELESAIDDWAVVIEMPSVPAGQKALAQFSRGLSYGQRGDKDKALADLAAVTQLPDATADQKATARLYLGLAHSERREQDEAISDFTAVIEFPNAPTGMKAMAWLNRGAKYVEKGELGRAIADFTAVEQMQENLSDQKARAVFFRGLAYSQRKEPEKAIADFTAVIALPDAPANQRAGALFMRGLAYAQQADPEKAVADLNSLIQMPDDPGNVKANALFVRGSEFARRGEVQKAIADLTAVIEMTAVPDEEKAQAFNSRGALHSRSNEPEKAIADYTAVTEMKEISTELKAQAAYSRGATHHKQGASDKAIADYTTVVDLNDCSAQQKAMALCGRGWLRFLEGHYDEAIDDNRQAMLLNPERWVAHANLAIALLANGKLDEALASYDAAVGLANIENLDEMTQDLHNLTLKRGQLHGISDVLARIEARKRSLSH